MAMGIPTHEDGLPTVPFLIARKTWKEENRRRPSIQLSPEGENTVFEK